jgi:hypothetical protein
VNFDATSQLLIIYSVFIKYTRKKLEYNEAVNQLVIDFKESYDLVRREVLYKILIEFDIPIKLARLIKMCLTETFNGVRGGKSLCDLFLIRNGLKQGDILWPFLFNFALACTTRRLQVTQNGVKLNGTHQLLVCAVDVSIMGGSLHTVKEKQDLKFASLCIIIQFQ